MKHFVSLKDYTKEELIGILDMALDMKQNPKAYSNRLAGKKIYTLFEKTSTRTFLSFTTGITELGGSYFNQNWSDSNFVLGETVSEIKYVGRNVDLIMARLKKSETTDLFAKHSTVPFINGCDNTFHPCQAMADMLTLREKTGSYQPSILYIGAKNNVFNSMLELFTKLGATVYGLTPLTNVMGVDDSFYEEMKATGHYVEVAVDASREVVKDIVKKVDAVYTDTWLDMEFFNNPEYAKQKEEICGKMMPYQINLDLMEGSNAIVLHDMPMHAGFEISQPVIDAYLEHILDQAENRRHAEKAVMVYLMEQ